MIKCYYHLRVLPRFIYHRLLVHLSNGRTRIDTPKCGRGDHHKFPTRNSDFLFTPVEKTTDAKTPGFPSSFQTLRSQNFRVGFLTLAQDRAPFLAPVWYTKIPGELLGWRTVNWFAIQLLKTNGSLTGLAVFMLPTHPGVRTFYQFSR